MEVSRRTRWPAAALVAVIGSVLAGGCSATDDSAGGAGADAAVGRPESGGGGTGELGVSGSESRDRYSGALVPGIEQSIVKDAALGIEVRHGLSDAVDAVVAIAGDHGGFVLRTSIEEGRRGTATMRLRVPSGDFERVLADLDDLGDVTREEIAGRDVTEEFIDLDARLRNLEAQERVLSRLMDDATTVAASIRVQRELTPVRLDIERIRGRMRFLEDRTSLGTIDVVVMEDGVTVAGGPIGRAFSEARAAFVSVVAGAIVVAGVVVPVALLAALAAVVARVVWRRAVPSHR